MWLKDLPLALISIASFIEFGLLIDYYIIKKRSLDFNVAIFFGLGIGFVAVLQMVFSFFKFPITTIFVKIITIAAFAPIILEKELRKQLRF